MRLPDPTETALLRTRADSRAYSELFQGRAALMMRYRPYIAPLHLVLLAAGTPTTVFDIGCGNGLMLYLVARQTGCRRLAGVDADAAAVRAAEDALRAADFDRSRGPSIRLAATHDPEVWPEGLYDAVLLVDVMHHVPPSRQRDFFLSAASRVAPGGRLVYKDIDAERSVLRLMNTLHDLVLAGQRPRYAQRAHVRAWASTAGLDLANDDRVDILWYRHTLDVFTRPT